MYNYQLNRHNVGINKLVQIHFTLILVFSVVPKRHHPIVKNPRLVLSLSKAFLLLLAWFG